MTLQCCMTSLKPWRGSPARMHPSGAPVTKSHSSVPSGGTGVLRPPLPPVSRGGGGSNGQVAMSALGSGRACSPRPHRLLPTPVAPLSLRSPDVLWPVPPSRNGSGCGRSDSTGSGVPPGQGSRLIWARMGWLHSTRLRLHRGPWVEKPSGHRGMGPPKVPCGPAT